MNIKQNTTVTIGANAWFNGRVSLRLSVGVSEGSRSFIGIAGAWI